MEGLGFWVWGSRVLKRFRFGVYGFGFSLGLGLLRKLSLTCGCHVGKCVLTSQQWPQDPPHDCLLLSAETTTETQELKLLELLAFTSLKP